MVVEKGVRKRKKDKFMGGYGKISSQVMDQENVAAICTVPFASCCPPGFCVCTVASGTRNRRKIGFGEITIDSAAEEPVCPREWCKEVGAQGPKKSLKFVNASGGQMGHYGEWKTNFKVSEGAAVMSFNFQVSDVQKPLAAVRRIAETGNIVQFGPQQKDNFIMNEKTGVKTMMVRNGGLYDISAEMLIDEGFHRQA
jgi:hypothetical protein